MQYEYTSNPTCEGQARPTLVIADAWEGSRTPEITHKALSVEAVTIPWEYGFSNLKKQTPSQGWRPRLPVLWRQGVPFAEAHTCQQLRSLVKLRYRAFHLLYLFLISAQSRIPLVVNIVCPVLTHMGRRQYVMFPWWHAGDQKLLKKRQYSRKWVCSAC